MSKWIDITQPLYNGMAVWPGDTNFQFQLTWTIGEDSVVNVGQLLLSTHTGTHIDAPYHFDHYGEKVQELDISTFIGDAQVVYLPDRDFITTADLEEINIKKVSRLLIRTDSWINLSQFPKKYTYLHPDIASYLAEKGIRLVGIDSPSVDFIHSKKLEAHHALYHHGIYILENVLLNHVNEGIYELITLPLLINEADGSPVRAILRVK
jgi:arylformamidase